MNDFNRKLKDEISHFRQVGHQFMNKEITSAEFKGVSGGMGVYAQRGGEKFMIRLRIPSGVLTYPHLKLITEHAKQYNLKHIHLTTRQAIQLHDLDMDDICDIMEASIDHDLYTRGSGGNFPRNVALSPLSGVEKKEAFDVTPYALQVGNYLMERMTGYRLPRKLKISFSNSSEDSANCTINDMGFLAVSEKGKPFFKLYLAGGLGMNPAISLPFGELVPPEEVLYHVEAVIRLFTEEGDYHNKGTARLRYIPRRMGIEAFMECYKKFLLQVKETLELERIQTVISKEVAETEEAETEIAETEIAETEIAETEVVETESSHDSNCLIAQKQKDLYTVMIHPLCGLMSTDTLIKLTKFLADCDNAEIRLSMSESMYIRNLTLDKAKELLDLTQDTRQDSKIQRSVSCVGVPTCQIGIEQSQALCKSILEALKSKNVPDVYLPSVHISGCNNSCARHQVNEIGFAGNKKRIKDTVYDVFELHVGGQCSEEKTVFGRNMGLLKMKDIPDFIVELARRLNDYKLEYAKYLSQYPKEFEALADRYIIK